MTCGFCDHILSLPVLEFGRTYPIATLKKISDYHRRLVYEAGVMNLTVEEMVFASRGESNG